MYKRKRPPSTTSGYSNKQFKKPRTAPYTRTAYNQNLRFTPRSYGNALAVTERKYFDTQASGAVLGTAGSWAGGEADPATLLTLFVPSLGNDINNRIGRKVQLLSIKAHCEVNCPPQTNQTAPDAPTIVRIALVRDMQTNGVQLNAEDVFASGDGTQAFNMFQNTAFFGRFKVLKDKRFVMQDPNSTYDGTNMEQQGLSKYFSWTVKFRKPLYVHFNGTNGGTIADIIDNSFHFLALASDIALVPIFRYKTRCTYIDV